MLASQGLQNYALSDGSDLEKCDVGQAPLGSWLGGFGVSGLTAYFAITEECKPQPGQTVLINGAAGAVGSIAGQIARLAGARVIGITGSDAKCQWLTETLGYHAAIDYREGNLYEQLAEAAPERIDVIFDNVGGSVLDESLRLIGMRGVVLLCGSTSQYAADTMTGPRQLHLARHDAGAHAAESVDWSAYGGAPGGGHYTAAAHIDADNVADLEVAWTHRSGDFREGAIRGVDGFGNEGMPASAFTGTPILVNDTLYYCTPFNRVFALDPRTGAERWVFDPEVDMTDEHLTNCRAVSSWTDSLAESAAAHCAHRIVLGTLDGRILALDGRTGTRCGGFGTHGEIDVTAGISEHEAGEYAITSAPAVLDDLIITGSYVEDSVRKGVPSGVVRAYDARTGEFRWGWNPVPPGMPARDETGTYTAGTTNVWSTISVDAERNLVIVPTGNSSSDYYGGERGGNLDHYSSSVVALDGATGEVVWHYQTVHHDIWDMDVPAQPTLVDLDIGGGRPAVVQVTKMGMTFVLDLETGEPLHPVEERPVPQEGAVPGEYLSTTQPLPLKPDPLHQLGASPEDAWGFTFWDRNWCRRQLEELHHRADLYPHLKQGDRALSLQHWRPELGSAGGGSGAPGNGDQYQARRDGGAVAAAGAVRGGRYALPATGFALLRHHASLRVAFRRAVHQAALGNPGRRGPGQRRSSLAGAARHP